MIEEERTKTKMILNLIVGGVLSLLLTYFLLSLVPWLLRIILFSLNVLGLLSFDASRTAMLLIISGSAYLPGGFIGGLYAGYKVRENPRLTSLIPGLIGFLSLILVQYASGILNPSEMDMFREIVAPSISILLGSYLGGYTVNWRPGEYVDEG